MGKNNGCHDPHTTDEELIFNRTTGDQCGGFNSIRSQCKSRSFQKIK